MSSRIRAPFTLETLTLLPLVALALWTLLCHVTVHLSGNFHDLTRWSWLPLVAIIPAYRWILSARPASKPTPATPATPPQARDWHGFAIVLTLVAIHEFSAIWFPESRLYLFWALAIPLLTRLWIQNRNLPGVTADAPPPVTRHEGMLLTVLLLLALFVTLIAHRPEPDDQFFSNLAVMTLEHPERPLLSWNGMLWNEGPSSWLAVDRLTSIELGIALVASLLGAEPVAVSHMGFAPLFAVWVVLAQGLLLRHLTPRRWLSVLMVVVFLLFSVGGETGGGFAVFAFVQLFFGKSVLFSALLPLLFLLGLRFMQQGSRRDWILMLLGNIAAVGLSTSGLFLAPVATGMGLIANWRPNRADTQRLLLGVTGCLYPLSTGLALHQTMMATMDTMPWGLSVEANLHKVFGAGTSRWLYLTALVGAWSLSTDPRLRRTLLGISFIYVGIFFNPFLYPIFTGYLTGSVTTWRLFFTIPLPIMAALMLISLVAALRPDRRAPEPLSLLLTLPPLLYLSSAVRGWSGFWSMPLATASAALAILSATYLTRRFRPLVALLALLALLTTLNHFQADKIRKRTTLTAPRTLTHFPPTIKEPPDALAAARYIVTNTPARHSALVPTGVAIWVATLKHAPLQVSTEEIYLDLLKRWLEPGAKERRAPLARYISGTQRPDDAISRLRQGVEAYRIGLIAIHQSNPWLSEIAQTLQSMGFQPSTQEEYRYWVRAE
ncbi:MAG: hypothetical protein HQM00_02055 [Magnetococcales bacterium]|nr:hypothetical protein [Magnetococcales bacterium]